MNRYILIRRLRWPAILVLFGLLALLDQAGVIDRFWNLFWPLLLILIGVMLLAERAALAMDGYGPDAPYPGAPWAGTDPNAPPAPAADPGSAIVPAPPQGFGNGGNGGQL
jgi:hypothetical protein